MNPYSGYDDSQLDNYEYIEDHHLAFSPYYLSLDEPFVLFPNISKKETRIFHNGNLALTEKYVYTGAGTRDGSGNSSDAHWSLLWKTRYYADSLGRTTNVVRLDGGTETNILLR